MSGGTALPTCLKAAFIDPRNMNPSGKDCNLAASRIEIGLACSLSKWMGLYESLPRWAISVRTGLSWTSVPPLFGKFLGSHGRWSDRWWRSQAISASSMTTSSTDLCWCSPQAPPDPWHPGGSCPPPEAPTHGWQAGLPMHPLQSLPRADLHLAWDRQPSGDHVHGRAPVPSVE